MKNILATLILNFSLLILIYPTQAHADVWDTLCIDNYRVDTAETGALKAEVNALAFFQDNELSGKLMKGYTLPGAWLQPKLSITPIPQIHLEAGVHLMLYHGANRYPNYAYHDIATWKGDQYQRGVHALPYFRAQANVKNLVLVLGDIYGAQNHQLIRPMFNPEQNLSTDPEMGFQMLLDRRHVHLDLWLNWQSYIFNLDTHQEAFTVGINSTIHWNRDKSKSLQWETPLQILLQHRGGEQDITNAGVQTLCNGSAGLRLTYKPKGRNVLTSLRAETNVMGSWQQHGTIWPFDTGLALHAGVNAVFFRDLNVELGYFASPRQYANLFGSPLFGTISLKYPGVTYEGMHTPYASVGYAHQFTSAYRLGAQVDLYNTCTKGSSNFLFDFGVYLRVCPDFVLKKGKK